MTSDELERVLDGLVRAFVQTLVCQYGKRPAPATVLFYREATRRVLHAYVAPRRTTLAAPHDGSEDVTPAESPTARRKGVLPRE